MNIKILAGLFICCICMFNAKSQKKSSAKEKPLNIILLLVDDLGWTDLSCYGSNFYETPNIDKLASQGLKFTNAYASCNVCSPSRASILTGKYPARLHVTDWIRGYQKPYAKLLPPNWNQFLPLEETTIAEVLKKKNYATASIGKWHLGDDPKYYPEHQGFDINIAGNYRGSPPSYFSPYHIPRLKDGTKGEHLTDRLTSEAMKFIIDKKDSPFFLYLSYYAVHIPLQAKEEDVAKFKAKINPESKQKNPVYAAMIKNADENIGRITALVDSLGLAENTMIIFMSDNGGILRSKNPVTSNLPLRSGKGTAYEGGVRIPFIVKWKGKIKENTMSDVPIIHADFSPTIAALAKAVFDKKNIDGMNISPLFFGAKQLQRDALYWHYPHYHSEGGTPYTSIRQGDWKLIYYYETGAKELYNLKNDEGEKNNLAEKEIKISEDLFKKIKAWKNNVGAQDPLPNPKYDAARANETINTERNVIDSMPK